MFVLYFSLSEMIIVFIGNYLNTKIKYESEQIYHNINKYKFNNQYLNGVEIKEYETSIYNNTVSVYKLKNGYYMHVRLYNFNSAYFENNKWKENELD